MLTLAAFPSTTPHERPGCDIALLALAPMMDNDDNIRVNPSLMVRRVLSMAGLDGVPIRP
jgi:hypothetical protein